MLKIHNISITCNTLSTQSNIRIRKGWDRVILSTIAKGIQSWTEFCLPRKKKVRKGIARCFAETSLHIESTFRDNLASCN